MWETANVKLISPLKSLGLFEYSGLLLCCDTGNLQSLLEGNNLKSKNKFTLVFGPLNLPQLTSWLREGVRVHGEIAKKC